VLVEVVVGEVVVPVVVGVAVAFFIFETQL
jgi:hypothetical protein